ncbi:MAG TPA: hypothetical protein VFN13_12685 [Rudaea sp.]|nr:hypothetical protein [Rudaea sp.]
MNYRLAILCVVVVLAGCGKEKPASTNPTAPAANTSDNKSAVANADFEQAAAPGEIPGWHFLQHAGAKSYDIGIDSKVVFAGHGSFWVKRTQPQVYGSLVQDLPLAGLVGKTVELSAMLKSGDVGADGWKLFINGYSPNGLVYSPGLTGSHDWQHDSVRLKITPFMQRLTIGVTLLDSGSAWVDNVEFHVVD